MKLFDPKTIENNLYSYRFSLKDGFSDKDTVLLLGGWDGKQKLDTLLFLKNDEESWKELPIKLPYSIRSHGAQFLNNSLYIFGGLNAENEPLHSTYKLSKSLQWGKMADMNQKRFGISKSSVILNDRIWVLGGDKTTKNSVGTHTLFGWNYLKSVEMYDPETNEWKFMRWVT